MKSNIIIKEINRIIFVGSEEYPNETTVFPPKTLSSNELIFNFSSHTTIKFNNKILDSKPNSLRFIPSGSYYEYIIKKHQKGDCIDIFFLSETPLSEESFVVNVKNEKIAPLFKKIFSVWVNKDEGYHYECISLLYKILAEMQKTSYLPESKFNKIKPALEYIQSNFLIQEKITAKQLSRICGISYSYIKRLFTQKFKISPKHYIIKLKMNYACDLLRHNEHNISQIAEICGYNDIYSFSRQFKNEYGVSPSNFTKKYKSSK